MVERSIMDEALENYAESIISLKDKTIIDCIKKRLGCDFELNDLQGRLVLVIHPDKTEEYLLDKIPLCKIGPLKTEIINNDVGSTILKANFEVIK